MNWKRCLLTVVLGMGLLAGAAQATPIVAGDRILIDMGTTNTSDTDGLGRTWNGLDSVTSKGGGSSSLSDLKNTAGTLTDVSITFSAGTGGDIQDNTSGTTTSALTDYPTFATEDSQCQRAVVTGSTYLLSGLDTSLIYDVTVYGSRGITTDRIMQVTIDGVSLSYNAGGTVGEGLVTFTGLTPNSSGEILMSLQASSEGGAWGYVGVVDVTAVPEPTTISLLLFGGLGVLLRRKR